MKRKMAKQSEAKKTKAVSAAKQQGLSSLRYEFGLYPTVEQEVALVEQCALVRLLQNTLNVICEQRYLRRLGSDPEALAVRLSKIRVAEYRERLTADVTDAGKYVPYLLHPGARDDPDNHDLPRAAEMNRWVTGMRAYDPQWATMSTHTPRRVVAAVDRAWQAFFRNLKQNPEMAGRPKRKHADDYWLPYVHNKRAGDIGSGGSGCELKRVAGRNWQLTIKGIEGSIHCRGQMPNGDLRLFGLLRLGRFIDADVKRVAGKWKLSICAHVKRERRHGKTPTTIEFGLIDGFARLNGRLVVPEGIPAAQAMHDQVDRLKSERDLRWPRRAPQDENWRDANAEITRLSSRLARIRRNALHVWTTRVVAEASDLTIGLPEVRKSTKTPRGDDKRWGANVETVSKINRNTLSYAPAMAAQMLAYKAQEAGIRCAVVKDDAPEIAVGEKLVAAGRTLRKTKRALRRTA